MPAGQNQTKMDLFIVSAVSARSIKMSAASIVSKHLHELIGTGGRTRQGRSSVTGNRHVPLYTSVDSNISTYLP